MGATLRWTARIPGTVNSERRKMEVETAATSTGGNGTLKVYRTSDFLGWDVRAWSPVLRYWEKTVDWQNVSRCLEVGAHQGGLSLWLASMGKSTVCSDLGGARQNAESFHRHYEARSLIGYEDIDATNIPYTDHFDIVIFKSILGGVGRDNQIDRQRQAIGQMYKSLKKGGKLLFAENLTGARLHQYLRKRFVKRIQWWRYVTVQEMAQFLSCFESYQMQTCGILGNLGMTERQRRVLGSIDTALLNRITPDHWKYIVYGVAWK
jgi:SAM-dependent methyltransferase